jgi:DHA2 family methylenomycin A resistance protein-like MFS transporter
MIGLVWAVIDAGPRGWTAPGVIAALVVTAIAGAGLLLVERRAKEPAIPLEFFKDASFSIATIAGFLVSLCIYGLTFALSLYFQNVLCTHRPRRAGHLCRSPSG